MDDVNDLELLPAYDREGSEAAFATLVARHINLVYSVAFRHTGNAAHAEEITQAVFVILAQKAASLRPDTVLEGWLYQTTRLTALSFLRGERRRQMREQEAYMQSTLADSADASLWNQLAPLLDDAMALLRARERDAIVLRYFQNKSLRDVGASLGVDEFAAQKRISRALEKLRKVFAKKGAVSTAETIAGTISANYLHAAPLALAKSVTAVAVVKGAAAGGSTLTLINGALKLMAWTNAKNAIVAGAVALLAIGTATVMLVSAHPAPVATRAAVLEISGIIQAKTYQDSALLRTDSNWFVATIDGTNSRIKAGPMGDPAIIDFEYGIMGGDSYLLISYASNLLATEAYTVVDGVETKTKLATRQKNTTGANLTINNGRGPEYAFGLLSPVWLAYGFQLDQANSEPKQFHGSPVFSMGWAFREKGGLADIACELNSEPPNFLKTLIETGDPKQFDALKLPVPAKEIFTNGTFDVLTWTNAGGLAVAQRFQAANNLVIDPLGGVVKGQRIVYEGAATNIILNALPPPAFRIPAATWVVEYRSAVIAPLTSFAYLTTNGLVMTREQLLQDEDFRTEVSEMPVPASRSPVKK